MTLSNQLLEILACPKCKGSLDYQEGENRLLCQTCKLAFPIKDGIPVMLVEESTAI